MEGSIKFGLWYVYIKWNESMLVSRVRFMKSGTDGPVPQQFRLYFAGKSKDFSPLESIHYGQDGIYGMIYRAVSDIPYGETRTYKEIAQKAGSCPRVVGMAMKRNITPIIIPCHRVVSVDGIGGFSPDISIKQDLLALERRVNRRINKLIKDSK